MAKAEVINPGERALDPTPPLGTNAQIASTEDKRPGCTIAFTRKTHPFDDSHSLVFVRGQWADGSYAPFPCTSDGVPFAKAPDKATNAPGGVLRQARFGGAYASHSGHYTSGYVFDVRNGTDADNLLAWLAQAKASFESRIPQTPRPPKDGTSPKAKQVAPTSF